MAKSSKSSKSSHLYELAKRGAEVRVKFIAEELRLLLAAFPHLKDAFDPDELPIPFLLRTAASRQAPGQPRNRKPMSAGARRAVSERMKRYWAARKAAESK